MKNNFLKGIILSVVLAMVPIGAYGQTEIEELNLTSTKAIVMDVDSGEVILSLNSEEAVQMASTTKLMTALLLAENRDKNHLIEFTELAMEQPSTSIYKDLWLPLEIGDKFRAEDVMKGLLLRSGNDMAYMIAEDIAGGAEEFSKLMDERAKEIGMVNTDFYTPTGLDMDELLQGENHHSTAYDLALLGIEALKNPWVAETMGIKITDIGAVDGERYEIENSNMNLGVDGCIGGKTGYTSKAGRCLVALYEIEGRTLVGVVLGGDYPDFFQDMTKVIETAKAKEKEILYTSEGELSVTKVNFKPFKYFGQVEELDISLYLKEDIQWYNNEFNKKYTSYHMELKDINPWELEKDTIVGELTIEHKDKETIIPIYSKFNIDDYLKEHKGWYVKMIALGALAIIVGITLIGVIIRFLYKKLNNR